MRRGVDIVLQMLLAFKGSLRPQLLQILSPFLPADVCNIKLVSQRGKAVKKIPVTDPITSMILSSASSSGYAEQIMYL